MTWSSRSEEIFLYLLVWVLMFAHVPLGIWAFLLFGIGSLLFFCCFMFRSLRAGQFVFPKLWFNLGLVLLVGWTFGQLIALPQWLLVGISPRAAQIWEQALVSVGVEPDWGRITFSPGRTWSACISLVSLSVFSISFYGMICSERVVLSRLWRVVFAAGVCQAMYGILKLLGGAGIPSVIEGNRVAGTFLNFNHYADCLLLSLVPGTLLLLEPLREIGVHVNRSRLRLRDVIFDRSSGGRLLVFYSLVLLGVAILVSGSRGGMVALGVYLLSIFLGVSWVQKRRGLGWGVLLFSVLTLWAGMWIAGIRVEQRWDQVTLTIRSILWQDGIEMIGEHPWAGSGLGSYRDRSRMNWSEKLASRFPSHHAEHIESDALEWVLEMGILGGLVLLFSIGGLILAGIKWQKGASSGWWGAWVLLSGGIAFGVHELGDFGLRKMPVFLLASLLIGATPVLIGCPSVIVTRGTKPRLFGILGFGFALLGCCLALVTIPRGIGEIYFHRAKTMEQMARNVEGELVRSRPFQVALEWYSVAGWWLFGDSRSHLSYGRLLEEALESRRVVVPKNIVPEIRSAYQQAILCAPCDPDPHLGLALHHARFGEVWEAKMHADIAEKLQPTSAWVHDQIGRIYWAISGYQTAESSDWRKHSLAAFNEAARRDPAHFKPEIMSYLRFYGVEEAELEPYRNLVD